LLVARVKKGLKTIDVAAAVDSTDATISRWENGKREGRCREIAKTGMFLGIRPDDLFLDEKAEPRTVLDNSDEELLAEIFRDLIRIRQLATRDDRNPLISIRRTLANVLEDFAPRESMPPGTQIAQPEPGVKTYDAPRRGSAAMRKHLFGSASEAKPKYGKRKPKN